MSIILWINSQKDSQTENNGQQQEEQNKKKLNESVLAESKQTFMQNLTEQQINDFGGQCENSQ